MKAKPSRIPRLLCLLAVGTLLCLALSQPAQATTFVVTKTADTNDGVCDADCSLREAIIAANASPGADIITLPAGTYMLTIAGQGEDAGATGDLDITDDLTINGAGAATTIVDGGGLDRVFQILSGTVAFNDLTIRNGLPGSGDNGGGILISSGTLAITSCTISGNNTTNGGNGAGIYADGSFTIDLSTISGNTTGGGGNGGGIYDNGGALTITGSTISGNSAGASGDGGGIYNNANGINLTNCTINGNGAFDGAGIFNNGIIVNAINATIASNTATNTGGGIENNGSATITSTIVANNTGGNCNGSPLTDGGTNLQFPGVTCGASITSADPLLGPLADNGGPTQTQALGAGSPAIDAGTEICPPTPPTDQRGVPRPQGPACDIGAFEVQGAGPTPTPTTTATPTPPGAPTSTPTPTPAGVPTATRTPSTGGAAIPTLSFPMLALLGLALLAAAFLVLRR